MKRSKLFVALLGGAAILGSAQFAVASTASQTRTDYTSAMGHASEAYKAASEKCAPLAGHEKDLCAVEAKAAEKRAKANAEADYKGTVKAKTAARIASADADYMVAKVVCDAKSGPDKEICVKQAEATKVKLVADAKAHKTAVVAKAEAREDTLDAQKKVALAKCDAMSGSEKDTCVTAAKSAHAK